MEVAGGLVVGYQVVSTAIEGGAVAGYALSKKTLPLKAKFSCIGTIPVSQDQDEASPDSLARSGHSLNIIDGDAYVFGGRVSKDKLAGSEVHILKLSNLGTLGSPYKVVPSLARDGDDVPAARVGHATCVLDGKVVMVGGFGSATDKTPLDEGGRVWLFDPKALQWSHIDTASSKFPVRGDHAAVAHGERLIIHGGISSTSSDPETDTWAFDLSTREWTQLPSLPTQSNSSPMMACVPPNLAIANEKLYLVAASTDLGSQIHALDLGAEPPATEWETITFPTNPLTPGPRPRKGAGLLPVKTGLGRTYLVFMFGEKDEPESSTPAATGATEAKDGQDGEQANFWSGLWALQLPSTDKTPAQLKDVTREKIGLNSHEAEWGEIEVVTGEEEDVEHGKSHPGPRGYFGCDNASDNQIVQDNKLVLWGGVNPNGDMQGDGWIIELST